MAFGKFKDSVGIDQRPPSVLGDPSLNPSPSAPNLLSFIDNAKAPLLLPPSHTAPKDDLSGTIGTIDPRTLRSAHVSSCSDSCVNGIYSVWRVLQRLLPILTWLPQYDWRNDLKGDIIGGFIIGVILVCQTMAHAAIATTQPVQGPYCALAPAITYALVGTTRHASISSGAVAAMLIAEQLEMYPDMQMRTHMASLLALLVGIILAVLGMLRAAFLVRFMSQPCLSGFVSAAALVIVACQLKHLLGVSEHVPPVSGFFQNVVETLMYSKNVNVIALGISIFCIAGIQNMKTFKIRHKETGKYQLLVFICSFKEILVVMVATLVMRFTAGRIDLVVTYDQKLSKTGALAPCIGVVPEGLPAFHVPWDPARVPEHIDKHILRLFPAACVIALTTYLTTYASSKRVAMQQGYAIRPNREAIALGMAGIVGSFFSCFPPSGSLSRASLLPQVGIKTQIGGLMASLVVGLSLSYLASCFYYLPRAALAGIIILASYGLQDFKYFFWLLKYSRMWGKPGANDKSEYERSGGLYKDVLVWICAFTVTLLFGVVYGITSAIGFSFFLLFRSTLKPAIVVLGRVPQFNMWRDVQYWDFAVTYPGIVVIQVRAPLFFGNTEHVREILDKIIAAQDVPVQYLIFDAGAVHSIDATALKNIEAMVFSWKTRGINCIMSNANGQVRGMFDTHLTDLQQVTFFMTTEDAVTIARKIIARRLESAKFGGISPNLPLMKIKRAIRGSPRLFPRRRSWHAISIV